MTIWSRSRPRRLRPPIPPPSADRTTNFDTNTANNSASAPSAAVINLPGTFQFATPTVSVPENAGSVTLTLDRINGTSGAVTVNYATADCSAIAGVNYTATSGTVNFVAGQTSATITIPVLDDQHDRRQPRLLRHPQQPDRRAPPSAPRDRPRDRHQHRPRHHPADVVCADGDPQRLDPRRISSSPSARRWTRPGPRCVNNYHVFSRPQRRRQPGRPIAGGRTTPRTTRPRSSRAGRSLPANRFYRVVLNGSLGRP